MTHAEIKEGKEAEIHEGDDVTWKWGGSGHPSGTVTEVNTDEGITIEGKKGGLIHKNASETDPALKIEHNGTNVVKRAREIEVVDNNTSAAEEEKEEEVAEEAPAKAEDGSKGEPIEIVDDEKEELDDEGSIEKEVEVALKEDDQDVEMESPKKNGTEKSAGEKRDRDDLDDLEDASSGGERSESVSEEDATSSGDSGVKKQKKDHSNDDAVAAVLAQEVVEDAVPMKHIDENIHKVEAEESAVAAHEEEVAVPA